MPGTRTQYSELNIVNSLATYLAGKLLDAGYLVYWYKRDALQTPDGLYVNYRSQWQVYASYSEFAPRLAAARGIVALGDAFPAEPRFITRPTVDGSVPPQDGIAVPALAIELGAATSPERLELGANARRLWVRHLIVDVFVRTADEQARFKDWLVAWFDEDTPLGVYDHDAGTAAFVDWVQPALVRVDHDVSLDVNDAMTYEVLLNARLEYVA